MGKQKKQDTGPSIFICINHSCLCPLQKAHDYTEFGLYASKCMIYNKLGFCSLHSEGALLLSSASFLSVVILKLPDLKMDRYSAGNGVGESILTETQICDWSVVSLSLCPLQRVCVCAYIHTYTFMYYLCIYIILCLTSSGHVLPFIPTDSWPWSQSKCSASSPNTPDIYHLHWTWFFSTGSFPPFSMWRLLVSSQPRDHWTLGPSIAPSILVQHFFSWGSCHLLKSSLCLLSLMLSSAYLHAPPLFRWLPSLTLSVLKFRSSHHLLICPPSSVHLLRPLTSSTSVHVSQVSLASCQHRELLLSAAWGFPHQHLTHWGSVVFQLSFAFTVPSLQTHFPVFSSNTRFTNISWAIFTSFWEFSNK